jgi:hypothetical protein
MCKAAIKNCPSLLNDIHSDFKTPDLCLLAVSSEKDKSLFSSNLDEVFKGLKPDPETYRMCSNLTSKPKYYIEVAFKHLDPKLQTAQLVKFIIANSPLMLKYVRDDLKTPDICFSACENKYRAFKFIKPEYKTCLAFLKYRMFRHLTQKETA